MKRYSTKDKKAHIKAYWKKKDQDPDYSLRLYAAEHGLKYYTLRDWYRDAEINPRWPKLAAAADRAERPAEEPQADISSDD